MSINLPPEHRDFSIGGSSSDGDDKSGKVTDPLVSEFMKPQPLETPLQEGNKLPEPKTSEEKVEEKVLQNPETAATVLKEALGKFKL